MEKRKQEILSLVEDGELDFQEVEFLYLGMKDFLKACESPQTLAAYVKEYVLSLDADLMQQHGFTFDSKGALTAQKKGAQVHLKRLRKTIVGGIVEIEDIVRPQILSREMPKETGGAHYDAFVKELDTLGIPEQSKQSFLVRAYEKRKAMQGEIDALATPEGRVRTFIEELFRILEPLIIQMLLTVELEGKSLGKSLHETRATIADVVKSPGFLLNVPGAAILYPSFYQIFTRGYEFMPLDAFVAIFTILQFFLNGMSAIMMVSYDAHLDIGIVDKQHGLENFHKSATDLATMLQSVLKKAESVQKAQTEERGKIPRKNIRESPRMPSTQEKRIGLEQQELDDEDQQSRDTRQTE